MRGALSNDYTHLFVPSRIILFTYVSYCTVVLKVKVLTKYFYTDLKNLTYWVGSVFEFLESKYIHFTHETSEDFNENK